MNDETMNDDGVTLLEGVKVFCRQMILGFIFWWFYDRLTDNDDG